MKKKLVVIVLLSVVLFTSGCKNNSKMLEKEVNNLLDRINVSSNEYYNQDRLIVGEMNNDFKMSIAYNYASQYYGQNVDGNNEYSTFECDDDGNCLTIILGDKIKKVYEVIFGKDTYKPAKKIYGRDEISYFYNEKTRNYYETNPNINCGIEGPYNYGKRIISINSDKVKFEIVVAQYNYVTKDDANNFDLEYTGELNDYTDDKVVAIKADSETWENLITNNINKLSHYKFTFNMEDNNYVFYSVEKIN